MNENEFDYEEYRNNLEMAAEIHDMFYKIRNIIIYFVIYSVLYSFVISTWITSGYEMFLSLFVVYLIAKIATHLFDELCFAVKIFRKNHKRREKDNG
ncbi:MAG: hypothetical protein NC393_04575 [Clostridium sp.]|nr:hypothetical protein [Clostridium sp.]MCM1207729.1 hypothetical protein [Ruminococcus sp.]